MTYPSLIQHRVWCVSSRGWNANAVTGLNRCKLLVGCVMYVLFGCCLSVAIARDGPVLPDGTIVDIIKPSSDLAAVGRINVDDLWDLAIANRNNGGIRLLTAVDRNLFQIQSWLPICEPISAMEFVDLTGSPTNFLAVAATENPVVFLFRFEDGFPILVNTIDTGDYTVTSMWVEHTCAECEIPDTVLMMQTDDEEILQTTDPLNAEFADSFQSLVMTPLCGYEPIIPADDGTVQGCMDRALHELDRCQWSACVLYEAGQTGRLHYGGQMAACGTLNLGQRFACLRHAVGAVLHSPDHDWDYGWEGEVVIGE